MARSLRIQFPGAYYHVMARGNRREDIFHDHDGDERRFFLPWHRTTVTQEWLAHRLAMRSATHVSQQLRRLDRQHALAKVPKPMQTFLAQVHDHPA